MTAEASARAAGSSRHTLVYLARHGQTPLNESDVLRGLADPPLDETWHRQDAIPQDNGCFNALEAH